MKKGRKLTPVEISFALFLLLSAASYVAGHDAWFSNDGKARQEKGDRSFGAYIERPSASGNISGSENEKGKE